MLLWFVAALALAAAILFGFGRLLLVLEWFDRMRAQRLRNDERCDWRYSGTNR
jgi:hypothetical protein